MSQLFREIQEEARANPAFAARLEAALDLGEKPASTGKMPSRRRRRNPAALDPFAAYLEGESVLRQRLEVLSVEQLKDIVAQHGMDTTQLALKWKTPDRLVALIIATVAARTRKGHAFRTPSSRPDTMDLGPTPAED